MTVTFRDGMAGIFVDIFSPVEESTGALHLFRFLDRAQAPHAAVPGIFNETYREVQSDPKGPALIAEYPSLVVSIEDYPEIEAVERGWFVILADESLMEIVGHIDMLAGAMRRFKLKKT